MRPHYRHEDYLTAQTAFLGFTHIEPHSEHTLLPAPGSFSTFWEDKLPSRRQGSCSKHQFSPNSELLWPVETRHPGKRREQNVAKAILQVLVRHSFTYSFSDCMQDSVANTIALVNAQQSRLRRFGRAESVLLFAGNGRPLLHLLSFSVDNVSSRLRMSRFSHPSIGAATRIYIWDFSARWRLLHGFGARRQAHKRETFSFTSSSK